ncbi:MAG: hypothetical protein MI799_24620 [Desulfobacterales bacterium]|nr:hypothetical protein [Desulfobacterales bacterium]
MNHIQLKEVVLQKVLQAVCVKQGWMMTIVHNSLVVYDFIIMGTSQSAKLMTFGVPTAQCNENKQLYGKERIKNLPWRH